MSINKKFYEDKRDYVEHLSQALKPLSDFDRLEYAVDYAQMTEFLRFRDELGSAWYIDVTANSKEAILLEVARLIAGDKVTGLLHNKERIRYAAGCFRREGGYAL